MRLGPVPKLGTRVEAKFDIRFCHFFPTPARGNANGISEFTKRRKFFWCKEKSNNKILLLLICPRGFKDTGIFFSSSFPRYRQIIGAPRGDILFLFSPACRENAFSKRKHTKSEFSHFGSPLHQRNKSGFGIGRPAH